MKASTKKQCKRCEEYIEEYRWYCSDCKKKKLLEKERRKNKRRSARGRHKTPEVKEQHRLHMQRLNKTPKYKLLCKAYGKVHGAIKKGELVKQPCEVCGSEDKIHAHHDSYLPEDLLNVRWLCNDHHIKWHYDNSPIYPSGI